MHRDHSYRNKGSQVFDGRNHQPKQRMRYDPHMRQKVEQPKEVKGFLVHDADRGRTFRKEQDPNKKPPKKVRAKQKRQAKQRAQREAQQQQLMHVNLLDPQALLLV